MNILFIIIDNSNHISYFPLGTGYIASVLRKEGHNVSIYNQDYHHYSEEHLKLYIENHNFDIIGIGSISGCYTYKKLKAISQAVNSCNNRRNFLYVLGGHMPSADPQYFINKMEADVVVKNEGELSILKLVRDMKPGIYESPQIQDLDSIPQPAYDLFPIEYYRLQRLPNIEPTEFSMSVITGRGCNWNCSFCFKSSTGIRLRNIQSIVNEIQYLKDKYNISYIDFADDLTMASKERAIELSEALIPLNIKWRCEGRLNFVTEDILQVMKKAGCIFINYGIESLDNDILKNIKKGLTDDLIIKGIEFTLKVGISPGLNMLFNLPGDNKETLRKNTDFLLKYDDLAQIRTIGVCQPYPGSELFNIAKERGLVKDIEDFFENKLKNNDLLSCNFMNISDNEAYSALYRTNFELLTNYYKKKIYNTEIQLKDLYLNKNINFRGWRHT